MYVTYDILSTAPHRSASLLLKITAITAELSNARIQSAILTKFVIADQLRVGYRRVLFLLMPDKSSCSVSNQTERETADILSRGAVPSEKHGYEPKGGSNPGKHKVGAL